VQWGDDVSAALQQSALSGKPILLHFYSNNCPPCKMLDTRAFKDEKVIAALSDETIPLKINVDKKRSIADRYEVTRWPTDVYLHPNGDEIGRSVSPQDPQKYCELVSRVNLINSDWITERIASQNPLINKSLKNKSLNDNNLNNNNLNGTEVAESTSVSHLPARVDMKNTGTVKSKFASQVRNESSTLAASNSLTGRPVVTKSAAFIPPPIVSSRSSSEANPYCTTSVGPDGQLVSECASGVEESGPTDQPPNSDAGTVRQDASRLAVPSQLVGFSKEASQNRYTQANARLGGVMSDDNTPAMEGFCPVTLRTQSAWAEGNPSYSIKHRGRIYYCASEEMRQQFLGQPDFYSPILSGYDIVHFCETGKLEAGRREFGCESGGHVFLFKDAQTYAIFQTHARNYLQQISIPSNNERVANVVEGDPMRR